MKRKKIWPIIIRDIVFSIVVGVVVYFGLKQSGSFLSMKEVQSNLREQLLAIKDSNTIINDSVLNLSKAYKEDINKFMTDGEEINNFIAIKILDAAKEKFPNKIDLEKIFVQQKLLLLIFSIISGLLGYIVISLINIYWFRLKSEHIVNNLSGVLKEPLDRSLKDIVPSHFFLVLDEFVHNHSIIINGITHNYPYNFVETIANWNSEQEKTKTGVEILTQCDVWYYNDLAEKLLEKAKKSIYSTTYYDTDELLNLFADKDDEKRLISWLKNANTKALKNQDSFLIKRVHIVDEDDEFINIYNKPPKEMIRGIRSYDKLYRNLDNGDNIRFDLYQLGVSNSNGRTGKHKKISAPKFLGEYIIFDESVLLKYNDDFEILEIYFGEIVDTFTCSFTNDYSKIKFQTDKLRQNKV